MSSRDEAERLDALARYAILDTPDNPAYDRIVRMVAQSTGSQAALMALSDADWIWIKAQYGCDLARLSRQGLLCDTTRSRASLDVVEDLRAHREFARHPLAVEDRFRFYAAAPLETRDGYRLGSLCLLDRRRRAFPESSRRALLDFAALLVELLELRRSAVETVAGLRQALDRLSDGIGRDELVTLCAWSKRIRIADEWLTFEEFLERRFDARVSHGMHPDVAESLRKDLREDS